MLTVATAQTLDPTSFSPGASSQQPALSLGTGTIVAGPDRVLDLVRPVTLEGVMTSDPSTGLMSLQTSMGSVTVQPNGALPPGQPVTVQITPGDPPTVTITSQQSASQQTAAQAPSQTAQTPLPQPAAVLVPASAANGITLPGQFITAIPIPAGAVTVTIPEISTENLVALPEQSPSVAAPAKAVAALVQPALTQPVSSQTFAPPANPQMMAASAQTFPASLQPALAQVSPSPTSAPPVNLQTAAAQIPATLPQSALTPPALQANLEPVAMPALSSRPLPTAIQAGTAEIFFTPASAPTPATQPPSTPANTQYPQFLSLIDAQVAGLTQPASQPNSVTTQPAMQLRATGSDTPATPFATQILAITPPGALAPSPAQNTIVGVVTGATLSGQPILQTKDGSFILQTVGPLPPGTQITLGQAAALPPHVSMLVAPPLDIQGGKTWPLLSQSLQVLAAAQPDMADAIRLAIPQAGPLMAPLLMQLVGAMRNGNTRALLSDKTLDALRHAGRGDIADALDDDLGNIGRQATTPTSDGWRTLPLPILLQGELGRLQLFLKPYPNADEKAEHGERDERTGTRFLIEVEPSAVGPIQLDGLVRNSSAIHRAPLLDMILRSRMPIPQDMQRDISRIFSDSLSASGLKGGIIFQGAGNWVTVGRNRKAPHGVVA